MARLSRETGISRRLRMMGKFGYMTTTSGSSALRYRCRTDIDLTVSHSIRTHSVLAVGYDDAAAVDLFDSRSLSQLPGPDLDGLALGTLEQVAWSSDGQTLYASGDYPNSGDVSILSWDGAGQGKRLSRLACRDNADTALSIVTLPEQKLLVTTANPCLTLFDGDDHIVWTHSSPKADFRQQRSSFAVSSDGMVVDFGFEMFGKSTPPIRCAHAEAVERSEF